MHIVFWVYDMYADLSSGRASFTQVAIHNSAMAIPFYVNYFYFSTAFFDDFSLKGFLKWVTEFLLLFLTIRVLIYLFLLNEFGTLYDGFTALVDNGPILFIYALWAFHFYALWSTGFRFFYLWRVNREKNEIMVKAKLQNDLQMLKNKIDIPLTVKFLEKISIDSSEDPSTVQEPILMLSNNLRYTLYDTNKPLVPLNKELEALHNLIELRSKLSGQIIHIDNEAGQEAVIQPGLLLRIYNKLIDSNLNAEIELSGENLVEIHLSSPEEQLNSVIEEMRKLLPVDFKVLLSNNRITLKSV